MSTSTDPHTTIAKLQIGCFGVFWEKLFLAVDKKEFCDDDFYIHVYIYIYIYIYWIASISLATWLISKCILPVFEMLGLLKSINYNFFFACVSHKQILCHMTDSHHEYCWLATFSSISIWWLCDPHETFSQTLREHNLDISSFSFTLP